MSLQELEFLRMKKAAHLEQCFQPVCHKAFLVGRQTFLIVSYIIIAFNFKSIKGLRETKKVQMCMVGRLNVKIGLWWVTVRPTLRAKDLEDYF